VDNAPAFWKEQANGLSIVRFPLSIRMPRMCVKTGKRTSFGNTRSHSLRHTRRTWRANIQKKRVFDPLTGTYKTMKVSAAYLRTLAKRLQRGKLA
jgi:large subunit ribosomal protein L28